jgi:hypothetical protein
MLAALVAVAAAAALPAPPAHAQVDVLLGLRQDDAVVLGIRDDDQIGSSLAIGDVTGDTIGDLLIGASQAAGKGPSSTDAGQVLVIEGATRLPGTILAGAALTTVYGPSSSANLGDAVAVGDLNADGIGDVVMGASKADNPQRGGAGTVFVMFGGANPAKTIDFAKERADVRLYGLQAGGALGRRVVIGDFNADGLDDAAISAPREGNQFDRRLAGAVYVFFGRRGLERGVELFVPNTLGVATTMAIHGPFESGNLGHTLAAGDVNGDGIDDILMGVRVPAPFGRIDSGDIYVVFGGTDLTTDRRIDLINTFEVDLKIQGPLAGDAFGEALGIADVNGDLRADVLVGAPTSPFVPSLLTGRAYAIFGRPFQPGTVIDVAVNGADVVLAGPQDKSEFGTSVSGGDLDADGFDDWVIGAPHADAHGQAYRVLGRQIWSDLGVVGANTTGARPGDRVGTASAFGDLSGDGIADLAVAAPFYEGQAGRRRAGAVYVILGRPGPQARLPNCTDADGDGFRAEGRTCGPVDCDDTRADIHPTAAEVCTDRIDNDCDGVVDQDGVDADGDGYPTGIEARCSVLDCNDSRPDVNPGAVEVCTDGVDNDCNGLRDVNDPECAAAQELCGNCVDDDGDGLGDLFEEACESQPLEFRQVMVRRPRTDPLKTQALVVGGRVYDAPFLNDPNLLTAGVTLGLGFGADRNVCLPLVRGKRKKNLLVFRGGGTQRSRIRFRPRKDGVVTFELEMKQPLDLPDVPPMTLSVGVFPGVTSYRGAAILRFKNSRVLVRDANR